MFLGQESKYSGKFCPPDSKNLQNPWYFNEKSSKIIDFPWFSLSELPYRKSQQPTCLLRPRLPGGRLSGPGVCSKSVGDCSNTTVRLESREVCWILRLACANRRKLCF